jgi:alpha-mannosidase
MINAFEDGKSERKAQLDAGVEAIDFSALNRGEQAAFATFEIPFGSIERPTTRNTPAEQAKFEVPALHWADLSDASHGFSLLNDSKYGYDAKANVLRLSLLRSPEWPDPHADAVSRSLYPLLAHLIPDSRSRCDASAVLTYVGLRLHNP